MNVDKAVQASGAGFGTAAQWVGRVAVVSVWGDLDALTSSELATAIEAEARQGPEALIVDLSNVQFLASAGMSVLITAAQELGPSMRFGVVADGPSTSRPLTLIGVDTLVAVYRTLDEALCD